MITYLTFLYPETNIFIYDNLKGKQYHRHAPKFLAIMVGCIPT